MRIKLLILCVLALLPVFHAQSQLAVGTTSSSLTIRGVSPGGSVQIYGIAREARGMYTDVVPYTAVVSDDDGNSIVTWNTPIALRSIWVVIDRDNGVYGVGIPAGYSATEVPITASNLLSTGGEGSTNLSFAGDVSHFLVVRPGTGAWQTTGAASGSGSNIVAVSQLLSTDELSLDPVPTELAAGDVVVMINSFRAEYGIKVVTP